MDKKNTKRRVKKVRRWPLVIVFLLGLIIMSYPLVTRLYYETQASSEITQFEKARETVDQTEINERIRLAQAYNDALATNANLEDPYSEEHKAGIAAYARMLELHEKMGYVQIPKINVNIPMYAGTAEVVLQKGVGHLEGTSLPVGGNSTHSVLTAHRGLPNARLFSELDKLELGDKFYIHNIAGVMAYQVDQILVIDPSDFSELGLKPGHDYVTLLTCTPYMVNSHRLIVRGHRIEYVAAIEESFINKSVESYNYKYAFYATLAVLLFVLFVLLVNAIKNRSIKKRRQHLKKAADSLEGSVADNMENGQADD